MAVSIFEDLVLRERGDPLLDASVSSERWWSRKATRGDNADTSVCETIHARSNSQIFFFFIYFGRNSAPNAWGMHNSARFLAEPG